MRTMPNSYYDGSIPFEFFASALAYSRTFTLETKTMLEKVVRAGESNLRSPFDLNKITFTARCHLALLLKEMGLDEQKQKECGSFLACETR